MLKDKVVLITGGTSGIGKALAVRLGQEKCKIIITGRSLETLMQTELELMQQNIAISAVVADVCSEADCSIMIKHAYKTYGKLDIVVCNAGISMRALFKDADTEVLRKVMDTNFWGTVHTCKYALPYLIESQGMIVGISSIAGYRGLPGRSGYSASKFAMQGFLESLRTELLQSGVHVLVACPGFTSTNIRNTALNALGSAQQESPLDEAKIMSAEAVAAHIIHAIKNKRRDLVLTTQGKLTVWLNRFFPKWMDKMVYKHFASEKNPLLTL
ncbi:MAG: SDR family oxidoreductase [Cytophagales bacterium]|nr:SDR family oxidoreductase [Cytophagales bacterium]